MPYTIGMVCHSSIRNEMSKKLALIVEIEYENEVINKPTKPQSKARKSTGKLCVK